MKIAYNNNEAKEFCQKLNSLRKRFKPQTLLISHMEGNIVSNTEKVLQRWSEYYGKHFEHQDGTDSDSGEYWTMCIPTAEPYVEPPNDADIEMAMSKRKNGKSTEHDQILAELIKEGVKGLKKVIYELILEIWEEQIIPHE